MIEVQEAKDKVPALSAPLRLVIDLTSRCNLRCAYCCFFSRPDESDKIDLPPERWVSLIDEAGRCGVFSVTLRGGEALLSPAFDAVLAAVLRNNMRFTLLTNGKIFTHELAARFAATGRCDRVKISLDGREEIHDRLRGKGSHRAALAAIEAVRAEKLPLYVTCAVHKYNYPMLPDIIRYFGDELKLPHFSFSGVSACEAAEYAMDEGEFHEAMHLIRLNEHPDMTRSGMYGGILRWRRLLAGVADTAACPTLTRQMSVLADGSFVPCPALCSESVGDLEHDSLAEAWKCQCAKTELLDRRHPGAECAVCPYAGVCRGVCAGVVLSELGGSWRNFCLRRHVEIYGSDL